MISESAMHDITDIDEHHEMMQFLSFSVGDAEYGVNLMDIKEIRGWSQTTRIPNSPEFMRGVINLRGQVIPIFDLRTRFDQGTTDTTEKHVVIVLNVMEKTIGILVDAVSDIVSISSNEIKPAPEHASEIDIEESYISGLISVNDKMIVLLKVSTLFDTDSVEQATTQQTS